MTTRFFSTAKRAPHLGPYPLERLARGEMPDLSQVPVSAPLSFRRPEDPLSIVNAMAEYQATMDAIRDGLVNRTRATIPADPVARAEHLKAFAYFSDASMVGAGPLPDSARLTHPLRNPDIDRLAQDLAHKQVKSLASGIDMIMADLRDSLRAPQVSIEEHRHALVVLIEMQRDPRPGEPGCDWIRDAQSHRACLRASEVAVVIANYIRLLGWDARAHTMSTSDVELGQLAVAAGLATVEGGALNAPFLGPR